MSMIFDLTFPMGPRTGHAAVTVRPGVTGLVGPSGAGKTSLLHAIAGLRPARGSLQLAGRILHDGASGLPAHARRIGLVFQEPRLFPHLSVADNLVYAHPTEGLDPGLVALLELGPLLSRRPATLSGGEARRVALGRTLHARPDALLLDEPVAHLDAAQTARLLPYLGEAVHAAGLPTLIVSHRAEVVLALADQVLLMADGAIFDRGMPADLLTHPGGPALRHLGMGNVLTVAVGPPVSCEGVGLAIAAPPPEAALHTGHARIAIAADDVLLATPGTFETSARNDLDGVVVALHDTGPGLVAVELDVGFRLVADITPAAVAALHLRPGRPARALIKATAIRWLGPDEG